ncbi:MAG TPA: hypothetical protein DIU07_02075 [Rhodobacteraceae bacterium]|nr:hypothetical protein [Paracoccaceae bacterium]
MSKHPVLGLLDHAHIPLAVLRDHFPEDFARLAAYRSFALIRDPFSRFPSSLHERFVQRDRIPLANRASDEVAREVDEVMAQLARLPNGVPITDPGLIHFSRQRDYVYLDGQQVVAEPRTVAEVDGMLEELSDLVGEPILVEARRNRRFRYASSSLMRMQLAVTRRIEKTLPRWIWKPVYVPVKQAFFATGLIQPNRDPPAALPNAPEVDAFVREFYAGDIGLFRKLEAARLARLVNPLPASDKPESNPMG